MSGGPRKNRLVPLSAPSSKKGTAFDLVAPDSEPAAWAIRRQWNQDVCRHSQEFMACFLPDGPIPTEQRIAELLAHMPVPSGPGEVVLLQSILTRLAFSLWMSAVAGESLASMRADRRSRDALTRARSIAPRWDAETAMAWAAVFRDVIAQVWPRWAARRAAALLTGRFADVWTLNRLAANLQCDAARLDDEFRRHFGMPPRDYLTRVRVGAAIDLLKDGMKVECVPLAVGYRSRKNLNRALERLTGLRPSQIRLLTATQLSAVRHRIACGQCVACSERSIDELT